MLSFEKISLSKSVLEHFLDKKIAFVLQDSLIGVAVTFLLLILT